MTSMKSISEGGGVGASAAGEERGELICTTEML